MYNLAKLLTDEPAKLEKLLILFLKLLIVFCFTSAIFDYHFSFSSLIKDPIPTNLTTGKLVYFFVAMIIIWFVLWDLIGELLIGTLLIRLIAFKFNKRKTFIEVLKFLGVISESYGFLAPKKYILVFTESLIKMEEDSNFLLENQSRHRKYFIISLTVYILLFISKDISLSKAEIWLGAIIILNFLVSGVFFHILNTYIFENYDSIKREFEPLAYSQKALGAINEIKYFKDYFEIPVGDRNFVLKRKSKEDNYHPERIEIRTAFHWNQQLGQRALAETLLMWNEKYEKRKLFDNEILLTNIKPTEEISSLMKKLDGLVYVYATTQEEIYNGLEEGQHRIQRRHWLTRDTTPALPKTQEPK